MLITGREVRMGKKNFARGLAVLKITNGFVYATLVIESACAPSTNDLPLKKWQRASNSDSRKRKMYQRTYIFRTTLC